MVELASLKPQKSCNVFDLAEQAGFDVGDWIASSTDKRGHKANPKYCYEWSFTEPGKVVIFNLWYQNMLHENGLIKQRGNFRADAASHRGPNGKTQWRTRATRLDNALQAALIGNLPIRVIVVDGKQRDKTDPNKSTEASKVRKRELDPEPWTLTAYDMATGKFELTRGILDQEFVDQFDMDQLAKSGPKKIETSSSAYYRDPKVRKAVLRRANGMCELCGAKGFEMAGGAVYLETHHVIPLADRGDDDVFNVAALCPNDHRRAHYAQRKDDIQQELLALLRQLRISNERLRQRVVNSD
ncbi:HNH endonuclease [Sphingopyxis sp.]|jgi:5-methylcytosine-specific restriction protein A|uniref:HNH endonuclease n=1 Tax=Sphingopyxis sp. TaxID=1908224 RepID=UPI003F6F26E4